jgi:ankyrin repeat protein
MRYIKLFEDYTQMSDFADVDKTTTKINTDVTTPFVQEGGSSGINDLLNAAKNGDLSKVREILNKSEVGVNSQDKDGYTGLMVASGNGKIEIVKELLGQSNIDPNMRNSNGWTALMSAVNFGSLDCVQELLKNPDIDVNAQSEDGKTALIWAVFHKQESDLDSERKRAWQADDSHRTDIVKELLNHPNIDLTIKDNNDWDALYWAKFVRNVDAVEEIIKKMS